jgi:hypothetical protein
MRNAPNFSYHLRREIARYNARHDAEDAALVAEAREAFEAREITVDEQIRKGTRT